MAHPYPRRKGTDIERLTGRIALITGAASGIGKATAERLAAEGAAVMVTDLNDEGGKTVVEALRNGGRRAGYLHLDVVSESEWQQAIAGIVDEFGGLDILVNNAGVHGEPEPLESTSLASWDRSIAILQTGVFLGMKWAPRRRPGPRRALAQVPSRLGHQHQLDLRRERWIRYIARISRC